MNGFGLFFTLATSLSLLLVARKWAAVPLLLGAAYMTAGQVLELGPLHFPVIRVLVIAGLVRVLLKGERIDGGLNLLDRLMAIWAVCLIGSSIFHTTDAWVLRLGTVWGDLGTYFLLRIFVQEPGDIHRLFKVICILIVPLALTMAIEKVTGRNCFASLGGVLAEADLRNGRYRASGPFVSAILAGTVGAGCFPMALCLRHEARRLAMLGMAAAATIVFSSGASGPVMMLVWILFALGLWRYRGYLRMMLWGGLLLVIALDVVMNDPVYFLLARIDITGGSTGWHRAALIQAAIQHIHEWWLGGTDHTRHWMPTGIYANQNHTDLTNHYLQMAVWGGLALMLLFMGILYAAFARVGKALQAAEGQPEGEQYLIWTLGAILFGHVVNFLSISYFDHSIVFFYLVLASIACLPVLATVPAADPEQEPAPPSSEPCEPAVYNHC